MSNHTEKPTLEAESLEPVTSSAHADNRHRMRLALELTEEGRAINSHAERVVQELFKRLVNRIKVTRQ